MKTIKIAETTGSVLDWLVAKVNGIPLVLAPFTGAKNYVLLGQNGKPTASVYTPSTSWPQGGPIIDQEKIDLDYLPGDCVWRAKQSLLQDPCEQEGATALIAAMRCYVMSKLGETAEVPEELV